MLHPASSGLPRCEASIPSPRMALCNAHQVITETTFKSRSTMESKKVGTYLYKQMRCSKRESWLVEIRRRLHDRECYIRMKSLSKACLFAVDQPGALRTRLARSVKCVCVKRWGWARKACASWWASLIDRSWWIPKRIGQCVRNPWWLFPTRWDRAQSALNQVSHLVEAPWAKIHGQASCMTKTMVWEADNACLQHTCESHTLTIWATLWTHTLHRI